MQRKRFFLAQLHLQNPRQRRWELHAATRRRTRSRGVPAYFSSLLFKCQSRAVSAICTQKAASQAPQAELAAQIWAGAALPGGGSCWYPQAAPAPGAATANPSPRPRTRQGWMELKGHSRGRELCKHSGSSRAVTTPGLFVSPGGSLCHPRALCATPAGLARARCHGHLPSLLGRGTIPGAATELSAMTNSTRPACATPNPAAPGPCSLLGASAEPRVRQTSAWAEKNPNLFVYKNQLWGEMP